ncbi:hypothetical protein VUR80DRAFT_4037 [Thermomyces stellatus]
MTLTWIRRTPLDRLIDFQWPGSCLYSPKEIQPRVRLAEAVAELSENISSVHADYVSPLNVLRFVMDSSMLIEDLGLPPLAAAILNRSERQLRSVLARYPNSVLEITYGMTALHLSSRWPAGLNILLSTDAKTLIN